MLRDFKAPDLKGVRFRPKMPTVLNKAFYKLVRDSYPDITLSDKEIKKIIWIANEVLKEKVIEKRDGVEFPEQLGYLFIGSVPETKEGNVDYKKSIELGKLVRHKNYETDGLTAKIFYTNFETSYHFRFHELWAFKPMQTFKKYVGKTYPERYTRYIRVDNYRKISRIFQQRLRQ